MIAVSSGELCSATSAGQAAAVSAVVLERSSDAVMSLSHGAEEIRPNHSAAVF